MREYTKPECVVCDDLAEGVFMASCSMPQSTCYIVNSYSHQAPETGRGDYRIQVNAHHQADAGHTTDDEILYIRFNQSVTYKCGGVGCYSGDGTTLLGIQYRHHNNPNDNIGAGDIIVESSAGLTILDVKMVCNHN